MVATACYGLGFGGWVFWDNGKENGKYYLGFRDNGKENGNYYSISGVYRDNGKENGNSYVVIGLCRVFQIGRAQCATWGSSCENLLTKASRKKKEASFEASRMRFACRKSPEFLNPKP